MKLVLEEAEEPEIKLPTSAGSWKWKYTLDPHETPDKFFSGSGSKTAEEGWSGKEIKSALPKSGLPLALSDAVWGFSHGMPIQGLCTLDRELGGEKPERAREPDL